MEGCPSGLRSWFRKPVIPQGTKRSNRLPSAILKPTTEIAVVPYYGIQKRVLYAGLQEAYQKLVSLLIIGDCWN